MVDPRAMDKAAPPRPVAVPSGVRQPRCADLVVQIHLRDHSPVLARSGSTTEPLARGSPRSRTAAALRGINSRVDMQGRRCRDTDVGRPSGLVFARWAIANRVCALTIGKVSHADLPLPRIRQCSIAAGLLVSSEAWHALDRRGSLRRRASSAGRCVLYPLADRPSRSGQGGLSIIQLHPDHLRRAG